MIDLLLGGSPCQGFSFAGKHLNFSDPRSKLFFDYVKALEALKPKYFLFENVKMKKEYQDVITKYLGVEPIEINSALVSAQNRRRFYWTNIPNIQIPKNKNIKFKDILQSNVDKKYYYSETTLKHLDLSDIIRTGKAGFKYKGRECDKCPPLTARHYKGMQNQYYPVVKEIDGYRNITPIECERLQTLPDNYTEGVSDTQRYKMLGNGWTVDVIAHILSFIPETYLHTVVSLFDGISCGQVALERAGKIYNQYYASEIDKYAIWVTQKNYPHTMQLGDVTQIDWAVFLDRLNIIQKVS